VSAVWAMLASRPSLDVSSINLILFYFKLFSAYFLFWLELRAYAHCHIVTTRARVSLHMANDLQAFAFPLPKNKSKTVANRNFL